MESSDAVAAFTALGHEGRLEVFRLLVRRAPAGAVAGEIAAALDIRPSTLSAHLTLLAGAGLIGALREGRTIRYRVRLDGAAALMRFLAQDCCRGRPELCLGLLDDAGAPRAACRVLFLCTGNSARSIMAEAILRDLGGGRFEVHSAGTHPRERADPDALRLLERHGHDTASLRPKALSEFRRGGAPRMDVVVTVCNRAANEDCHAWEGSPVTSHWGLADPAAADGDEAARLRAFQDTYRALRSRIAVLLDLPATGPDRMDLQRAVDHAAVVPAEGT